MKCSTRLLTLVIIAAIALLAAANVGVAKPLSPTARQANCTFGSMMTFPCKVADKTFSNGDELMVFCSANKSVCGPPPPGKEGGNGGNGGNGGFDYGNLEPCDPGVMPTPTAPCRFDMPDCEEGQRPSVSKPCRNGGMGGTEGEMGGFDAPPSNDIKKEMQNKYMVINISTEGSGDQNGSLDVTFVKAVSGVKKVTLDYLNDQLVGESFVIQTTAKTKCFADTKDPDKIPDLVSCKELDDAADNAPGSIKSQFRGKIKFNAATFEPEFTAKKIVFLKGTFNIAKIRG